MIPREIIARGISAVYGWLHQKARAADRLGHKRYYRKCFGGVGVGPTPESEPLIRLARRLYRLRNIVGDMMCRCGIRGYTQHGI